MTDFDIEQTDKLLTTTRSVRKRIDLNRPVSSHLIRECLRTAVQAPTGSNQQGWRWLLVTDLDLRKRLARLYVEAGEAYLATAAGQAMDHEMRQQFDASPFATDILWQAPVHVIPCIEGRAESVENALSASTYGSILPAVWSFMLALRSRGLSSTWTTRHLFKEREAADLLGIPYEDVTQVALIPVGHTLGTDFRPARRTAVEQLTFWNLWGNRELGDSVAADLPFG